MEKQYADKIFLSECVFTANTTEPFAGAVAVKGDSIVGVGAAEKIAQLKGPETEVLDFGDATILPGFNDSHLHFSFGAVQSDPDYCAVVLGCADKQETLDAVRVLAEAHPENPWVYAFGWGATQWEVQDPPTRQELDAIDSERPICVTHFSGHTVWCNTKALEIGGITRDTPDPEGGIIVRDEDGEPTGLLLEEASKEINTMALTVPDLAVQLRKLMGMTASLGITAVGDVFPHEVGNDVYGTYAAMAANGEMTCRVTFFPSLLDVPRAAALRNEFNSDWVRVGGVKQLLDGILEAGTAWMLEPYVDNPENSGAPILTEEQYERCVTEADAAGLPVRTHCIGDATARMAIDVHERVQKAHGKKGLRHCLEHLETAQASDIERMAALDLCACVQPLHAAYGNNTSNYDQYIGDRASHTWRFADMRDAGVHLAMGTDFPAAAALEPMQVLQAAVTRCLPDGFHIESYQVDQTLPMGEALQYMTQGSAYVESFDHRIGTLEEGKLADIVVMDRNLFAIEDPLKIQEAQVRMTVVGGKTVYEGPQA